VSGAAPSARTEPRPPQSADSLVSADLLDVDLSGGLRIQGQRRLSDPQDSRRLPLLILIWQSRLKMCMPVPLYADWLVNLVLI